LIVGLFHLRKEVSMDVSFEGLKILLESATAVILDQDAVTYPFVGDDEIEINPGKPNEDNDAVLFLSEGTVSNIQLNDFELTFDFGGDEYSLILLSPGTGIDIEHLDALSAAVSPR
jgi:hypothetical protein